MASQETPPIEWQNRIVRYGVQAADQFTANPNNPRRHPQDQRDAVKGSLDTLGWIAPVIVNSRSGFTVDGHERIFQALAQGDDTPVPFIEVDLSDEEEAQALATFDWITQMATYDQDTLTDLLHDIDTDNADLQALLDSMAQENGIDLDEDEPLEDAGPDIDRGAELAASYGTALGQIWQLGKHRLAIGDSTDQVTIEALMDGDKADMVFTDPPYQFQLYGGGFSAKEIRQDHKDKLAPLTTFDPTQFIEQLEVLQWASAIIFTSKNLLPQYMAWASQYDFNLFVWHKTNPPPFTNNTFLPDLEYLVVAHRPNKIFNNGLGYEPYSRMYSSDIHEGKDAVLASHPTMKPLPIMTRYINVLSNRGGIVFDPFLGSGTTLIAAHQTGRICYGCEISPQYAAVVIQRWETLTGDQATLITPRLDSTHEIPF